MNSELIEKTKPYPKLMKNASNIVVLFTKDSEGVIINYTAEVCTIGVHITTWNMRSFTDFHGEIKLKN